MFIQEKRRITEQMLAYWNTLRGDKKWPAAQSIMKTDIPSLWEDILLVKVRQEGEKFSYESIHRGKNIAAMLENDALELKEALQQKMDAACHSRNYVQDEGIYTSRKGFRIKYRQIILPMGPDSVKMDHLLCAMRHAVEDSGV